MPGLVSPALQCTSPPHLTRHRTLRVCRGHARTSGPEVPVGERPCVVPRTYRLWPSLDA